MEDDLYLKLLNNGFRFVSYRPRSEKETRDFLEKKLKRRKMYAPNVVDKVINRLYELGYLDDDKFVEWWINERATHRQKGKKVVLLELKAKGISRELLENATGFQSELEMAKKALTNKIKLYAKLSNLERKKKIYGFLGRRGFSGETIDHIIDELDQKEVQ